MNGAHAPGAGAFKLFIETEQFLLFLLVVRVLEEHGEELERVALSDGRAAGALVHSIELRPRPPRIHARPDELVPGHLALDRGEIKDDLSWRSVAFGRKLRGTASTHDAYRIQSIGPEPQRPQQSCRRDAGVDFAVRASEPDFHLVVRRNRAGELRRAAAEPLPHVVAGDGFAGREPACAIWTGLDVLRRHIGVPSTPARA